MSYQIKFHPSAISMTTPVLTKEQIQTIREKILNPNIDPLFICDRPECNHSIDEHFEAPDHIGFCLRLGCDCARYLAPEPEMEEEV